MVITSYFMNSISPVPSPSAISQPVCHNTNGSVAKQHSSSHQIHIHIHLVIRFHSSLPIYSQLSRFRRRRSLEIIRPTLLLRPDLLVMRLSVDLQLLQIRIDDFFTAIRALLRNPASSLAFPSFCKLQCLNSRFLIAEGLRS